jgi:carboxyl-terminal processing protease
VIKSDTLTSYSIQLRRLNLFYLFTETYMASERKNIEARYKNYVEFKNNFVVTEEMFNNFKKFAESKEVVYNEEYFNADKDFIGISLKSLIARDIWGNEGSYATFIEIDNIFLKAITLFDEAKRIMDLK